MADDHLKPSEAATLLLLMAEAREVGNPELEERYGVTLTGESRKKLTDLKLVESRRGSRGAYFHQLSERGWAWCNDGVEIGKVQPRAAGQALVAVLAGLQRYLNLKGLKMVHVFASDTVAEPTPAEPTPAEPTPAGPTVAGPTVGDLETEIRAAYRTLAVAPGDWVSLADLRPLLGDADRKAIDRALTKMIEESRDVNLVPESNQKELTDPVRAAAVWIGGQNKHLISIGVA